MALQHYILGWVKKHPSHGYFIKQCYQTFINPSEKLNDATLYPMLRKMEEEGLIRRDTEDQDAGPSRKVVTVTEKGAKVFDDWLKSDADEGLTGLARYDFFRSFRFLTKYAYFHELDDELALAKVQNQLEARRERLADYRGARESMLSKGLETCKIQAIDYGIALEETNLRWLQQVAESYSKKVPGAKKQKRPRA